MIAGRCLLLLAVVVCSSANTTLAHYLQEREQLIAIQESMRFDYGRGNLTTLEKQVNKTLCDMRTEMRKDEGITATPFRLAKDKLSQSSLFKMLHTMPKGALLHLHWDSTLPIEFLIKNGTHRNGCYIYWSKNKTANSPPFGTAGFFNVGQEPEGYKPAEFLRQQIPNFDEQLLSVWDVLHNETTLNESIDPWGPFSQFFVKMDRVFLYKPVFEDFMTETLLRARDIWGVNYLELRSLGYQNNLYDLVTERYSAATTVKTIQVISNKVKLMRPGFMGVKLIYSQYRLVSSDVLDASLKEAFDLIQQFPDFVIGYDLVGQEDSGHTLRYFAPQLVEYVGKMDFYFHAGETDLWGSGGTSDNINDAVLLKTKRIGHGLAMSKLPYASQVAKREGIAVEVCPLSNQGLQFVLDLRDHPAATLIAEGNPIVLSNDDPSILDTCSSLAYDWTVAVASWDIDLSSIKVLIENSITYSGATEEEKQVIASYWESEWNEWLQTVMATHK